MSIRGGVPTVVGFVFAVVDVATVELVDVGAVVAVEQLELVPESPFAAWTWCW